VSAVAWFGPCAAEAAPELQDALIKDVPHVAQRPDFCGEACAEMFLKKLGKPITQDAVFNQSGVDPLLGRGCWARELALALQKIGFKTGTVGFTIDPAKADHRLHALRRHAQGLRALPPGSGLRRQDRRASLSRAGGA
jgi:hypothetical protein